jgi:hypothetical protein
MKQWTLRLGLSLMVCIGGWTGRLPAQAPASQSRIVLVKVPAPAASASCPADGTAAPGTASAPRTGPIRTFWRMANDRGCFATHNTVGCSSCWGDMMFIFGSCRTFFGEPCAPPPPGTRFFGR